MAAKVRRKARDHEAFSAEEEAAPVTPEVPNHVTEKRAGVTIKRLKGRWVWTMTSGGCTCM